MEAYAESQIILTKFKGVMYCRYDYIFENGIYMCPLALCKEFTTQTKQLI
jgi:hypothetical protein